MNKKIYFFFISFALLILIKANAQTHSAARSLSMARAYTAVARGVFAPAWNPANLAFPDRPSFDLQLVSVGFRAGNVTISKSTYDKYNGKYLTDEDIQHFLSIVPDNGLKLYADTDAQVLGFSVGSFALTFSGVAASDLSISKEYLKILLEGFRANQRYNLGDNSGEVFGYSSVTASYAFPLSLPVMNETYIGLNASYLIGFGCAEVLESYGQVNHELWEVSGSGRVRARYAQGGAGFATDFGIAKYGKDWQFGIMLKNAFSTLHWTSKPEEFKAQFYTHYGLNVENTADEDSVEVFLQSDDETREIAAFSTSLPAELRIGLARKMRSLLLAMDYQQGFSRRPGISKTPYVALGMEWQGIGFFPLRLGLGFGGEHKTLLATGFGFKLGFFRLDYGASFYGALAPNKASTLGMALSSYLSF